MSSTVDQAPAARLAAGARRIGRVLGATAKRRWLSSIIGVVVLAGVATFLLLWQVYGTVFTGRGPFDFGDPTGASIGVNVGQHVTWGATEGQNTGDGTIVVDSVSVPSKESHFVRRVMMSGPGANLGVGLDIGYPPPLHRGERLPLQRPKGTTIRPGKYVWIVIELIPRRDGEFQAGPVSINYHIGRKHYRMVAPSYVNICAPHVEECPNHIGND